MFLLFICILLFTLYRMVVHSIETFHEGNKLGGGAIVALIPVVIGCAILFQMYK